MTTADGASTGLKIDTVKKCLSFVCKNNGYTALDPNVQLNFFGGYAIFGKLCVLWAPLQY
jgi:hypothetical protein